MSEMFVRLEKNIKKLKEEKAQWKAEFEIMRREMFNRLEKNEKKADELEDTLSTANKSISDLVSQLRGLGTDNQREHRGAAKDIESMEKRMLAMQQDVDAVGEASAASIKSKLEAAEVRVGRDVESSAKKAVAEERQDLRERIKGMEAKLKETQAALSDRIEKAVEKAAQDLRKTVTDEVQKSSEASYEKTEERLKADVASMKESIGIVRKNVEARLSALDNSALQSRRDIDELKRLKDEIQSLRAEQERKLHDMEEKAAAMSRRLEAVERVYADEIKKLSEEAEEL